MDKHAPLISDPGTYVDLDRTPEGHLLLRLTARGRQEFADFERFRDEHGIHAATLELLADHLGNGWEEVRPEEIGALTSALLLSDTAVRDVTGQLTHCESVYFNPMYQVMDEISELRAQGEVLFHGAS